MSANCTVNTKYDINKKYWMYVYLKHRKEPVGLISHGRVGCIDPRKYIMLLFSTKL